MSTWPYFSEPTHDTGQVIDTSTTSYPRTTAVSNAEGRLKVDVVDRIFLLEPTKHPLVSLLTNVGKVWDGKAWKGSGMLKKSTGNPTFSWFEDYYGGRYAKVSGSQTAADTSIEVTGSGSSTGSLFTKGDIVKNQRTGENFMVSSVSSNTLTVTRAFGSTAAAAMNDGDGLFICGNVNEENAGARYVNTTRSTKMSNYT